MVSAVVWFFFAIVIFSLFCYFFRRFYFFRDNECDNTQRDVQMHTVMQMCAHARTVL